MVSSELELASWMRVSEVGAERSSSTGALTPKTNLCKQNRAQPCGPQLESMMIVRPPVSIGTYYVRSQFFLNALIPFISRRLNSGTTAALQ